jgi:TonB family protein
MAHERGHIRQRHSLDVVLVDTLTVLQWFNPAMWMLRQDLRAIHEYEADAAVLSQGINMRQYQYLLIQKAVATCGYSVANGITHSTLKNRINMMLTNKKSTNKSWLKTLALLPIVAVALALNAETVNDYVYEETPAQPQKKIVKKGRKDAKVEVGTETIEVKANEEVQAETPEDPAAKPFVLRVLVDDIGRVVGLTSDDKPKAPYHFHQLEFPVGQIFIDHREATLDEVVNYEKLGLEWEGMIHNPNNPTAEWNFKDKDGILVFRTKKAEPEKTKTPVVAVDTPETSEAFDVVETMPEFPGGVGELMKFLSMAVKYPEAAEKTGTQGRVIVSYIVEKDGSISSAKVQKSVSEELDAEALRVVNAMPKWKPGTQKGEAVRVKYTIPISFRLK